MFSDPLKGDDSQLTADGGRGTAAARPILSRLIPRRGTLFVAFFEVGPG